LHFLFATSLGCRGSTSFVSEHDTTTARFKRVRDAAKRGPLGRTKLYGLAQKYPGLFLKYDGMTIVDMKRYEEILATLPPAELKPNAATKEIV
jgi:hypothetical protein